MAINLPGQNLAAGDLARVTSHEANDEWPYLLEIVAYYGKDRRGRRKSITISQDEFMGRNGYGAPMTSDVLWAMINRLRKG